MSRNVEYSKPSKTWGTRHTILLRNARRKNDVGQAPIKKRFHTAEKQEIANSLHATCPQEKSVQKCVGFSDKCLNRHHTSWFGMTPTPCPTRHLSHHWIMADANKHAVRTRKEKFSHEMMNLPFLYTSETTSINTDETRHPSVKKPLPMRKQVSDGNAIHHTHHQPEYQQFGSYRTGIWTKIQNRTTTQDASREDTTRINNTQQKNRLITQSHNTTLLFATCPATSSAKQRVLTKSGSHGIFGSVLTWLANFLQQWVINNRPTSTSDLFINWHPNTTHSTMLHNKLSNLQNHTRWNMGNSAWNSILTLIHRRPDSIVLQPNTNKYLFLSKHDNHPQQSRHYSNRTRKKATGTPNLFTRIALTTKWTKLLKYLTVILPRAMGPLARTPWRKTTLPAKHALIRNPEWDHTNLRGTHASLDIAHSALQINTTKQHVSHTWNLNELPSGIQLIQRCHEVILNTSTQKQLSHTPRTLRKKPQKVSGDVFHQKHQLLTFASTDIPGFTHHTHKHLRHMRETNNSKQTQGTTCDDTQCNVKSRREKLLSVNSDLETKLRILFVARHVPESWSYWLRCGTPRWLAWQNMVQELAAGPSSPMPMWQTDRNQICNERSTSAKHTDALPWTQTPNHDNFMNKKKTHSSGTHHWQFSICGQ